MNISITGTMNEISNFGAFLTSVIDVGDPTVINLQNANTSSFQRAPNIRVHLGSVIGAGSFFPPLSIRDTTNNNGRFDFTFNDSVFPQNTQLYFVAYQERERITISPGVTVPIFQPVYRSGTFRMSDLQANNDFRFFFDNIVDAGLPQPRISQADVNNEVAGVAISGMTSLSASIRSNHVRVRGRGAQGAEVTFELKLKASTSNNLNRLIKHEIDEFDLDVPFPANLCVNSDEIEDRVSDSVRDLIRDLNTTIMNNLTGSIPANPLFDAQTFFAQNGTVTCADVDYPVVAQQNVTVAGTTIPVNVRAIDLEVYAGFPRRVL